MTRIAIVEDSPEYAKALNEYCLRYAEEKGKQFHVDVYQNGLDFVSAETGDYDIIMLDIKMPYMNGLQTAQKIRETNANVCIVFITSMQQYAIHGYAVQAADFIVKPVQYNVFSFKMDRIVSIAERSRRQTIVIKTNKAMKRLDVADIIYIETQLHKVIYHTKEEVYETWGSMKSTCAQLPASEFALCNSCYLVNLRHVEEINSASAILTGGVELPISRMKRKGFLDAFAASVHNTLILNEEKPTGGASDGRPE